ncbi:hypothetical protein EVAR_38236_1 [Eumeta japonica]|uniref:Uncharacterized protein n=1 Tax=Eumeta variegata TaxID=151549 RepID=A0A4C1XIB2_EUMVA|nr:hypothetical protein EVAR_38236_1 [Eumeta japonica]
MPTALPTGAQNEFFRLLYTSYKPHKQRDFTTTFLHIKYEFPDLILNRIPNAGRPAAHAPAYSDINTHARRPTTAAARQLRSVKACTPRGQRNDVKLFERAGGDARG